MICLFLKAFYDPHGNCQLVENTSSVIDEMEDEKKLGDL